MENLFPLIIRFPVECGVFYTPCPMGLTWLSQACCKCRRIMHIARPVLTLNGQKKRRTICPGGLYVFSTKRAVYCLADLISLAGSYTVTYMSHLKNLGRNIIDQLYEHSQSYSILQYLPNQWIAIFARCDWLP